MLLPALNKARAKARGIACVNNKKQFGLAQQLYASDNNDFWVGNTSDVRFNMVLAGTHANHTTPYINWGNMTCTAANVPRSYNSAWRSADNKNPSECGTDGVAVGFSTKKDLYGEVAINGDGKSTLLWAANYHYTPNRCKAPSSTYMFGCTFLNAYPSASWYMIDPEGSGDKSLNMVHEGRAAITFFDGSAILPDYKEVRNNTTNGLVAYFAGGGTKITLQ